MKDLMFGLYIKMLIIRKIEERIALEYPKQEMRCPVHLSIGQEACAVGICEPLTKQDLMVSTHRGHAHYLAKGGDPEKFIAELYGKATGCSRGQGGSMHLVDREYGFAGSTSIVGGTIPIGVGLAFAKKLRGDSGVVVVCIGDAAIEEGVFHESANFAALHKLPVIFVCENNLYSCFTHLRERQPQREMFHVAQAHDLFYMEADGQNVLDVKSTMLQAVSSATNGRPIFLTLDTYRYVEHCGPSPDDHLNYRSEKEVSHFKKRDPLKILQARIEAAGFGEELAAAKFDGMLDPGIDELFTAAKCAPFPSPDELGKYLYANS